MRKTKKRFIVVGILICIAGALFDTLSSSILGAIPWWQAYPAHGCPSFDDAALLLSQQQLQRLPKPRECER